MACFSWLVCCASTAYLSQKPLQGGGLGRVRSCSVWRSCKLKRSFIGVYCKLFFHRWEDKPHPRCVLFWFLFCLHLCRCKLEISVKLIVAKASCMQDEGAKPPSSRMSFVPPGPQGKLLGWYVCICCAGGCVWVRLLRNEGFQRERSLPAFGSICFTGDKLRKLVFVFCSFCLSTKFRGHAA